MTKSVAAMRSSRAKKALYGGAKDFEPAAAIRASLQGPGAKLNVPGRKCCIVFTTGNQ